MLDGLLWLVLYYFFNGNYFLIWYFLYIQHEAVCGGIEDLVQLLLQNGANPNIPGGNGQNQTPLHDAAFLNKSNIVKLLLAIGADVNARNADGKIPR